MVAFSEDFLYQLRLSNSIESTISSYTQLKRRGNNHICLCPFHSEKTPSCTVYTDTQSFYCFGCGAGGDVITFVMKIENLEYIEAIKLLAERGGITVPDNGYDDKSANLKRRVYEINRESANYFYRNLRSENGRLALTYLINRGISAESIKKYGIGYASNSFSELKSHLLSEGFTEDELEASGMCFKSRKTENLFDVYRNRVMFPIIDLRGNVIGFGGRALDTSDGKTPKYINSSDTPVFKKSRHLFSLNFAKNTKERRLILAEGYMDVVAVNQAGFENVVATLGTAITPDQTRLISQYADEVIISYDSDEAGQKATQKAINLLSEVGVKTKIIKMEGAKDPDEYIKKFGAGRYKLLLDHSEGAINFELEKCKSGLDLDTEMGKTDYLKRCINVFAQIANPVEREVYILKISNEQGINKEIITSSVNNIIKKNSFSKDKREWQGIVNPIKRKVNAINADAELFKKEAAAENGILSYIFFNPNAIDEIHKSITPEQFVTDFNKKVYQFTLNTLKNSQELSMSSFNNEFSPDEMGKISEIIAKSRTFPVNKNSVVDYIQILKKHYDGDSKDASEMSDDEFKDFINQLKNKK